MVLPLPQLRCAAVALALAAVPALTGCGTPTPKLPGPPESFSHRVERDDLPSHGRLVLDAGNCHVRVVHGFARAVRLDARIHGLSLQDAQAALGALRIDATEDPAEPGHLRLSAACPSAADSRAPIHGQWTLVVPEGDAVTIHADGGTVDVQALDCDLDLETDEGPIRADVVAGDLSIRTDSGRVRVAGPFGHVEIDSDRGPVDVAVPDPDLTAARLMVRTDSARVSLHAAPEDLEELWFTSARGSVEGNLKLPVRFDPETGSVPLRDARLRVETESGDLYLWRLVESRSTSIARARGR